MFVFLRTLIILLIAISVIRSVVNFARRLWYGAQSAGFVARPPQAKPADPQGTATLLHQDPVCGTYVAVDSSLKRIVNGDVIHFCSTECRNRYTV